MPVKSVLITLETNKMFLDIAEQLIKYSGLYGGMKLMLGTLEDHCDKFVSEYGYLDFVFLDHWKDMYMSDLKLLESKGLLKKGTCVVADNVLYPGVPECRKYVAFSPKYMTVEHGGEKGYTRPVVKDIVTESVYQGEEGVDYCKFDSP